MTAPQINPECLRALEQEAARQGMSVAQLVESYARQLRMQESRRRVGLSGDVARKRLREFWASLPKDYVPPTDEEVERIVHERRMRKSG